MEVKGMPLLSLDKIDEMHGAPPLNYYTPHVGASKKAIELGLVQDYVVAHSPKRILASSRDLPKENNGQISARNLIRVHRRESA